MREQILAVIMGMAAMSLSLYGGISFIRDFMPEICQEFCKMFGRDID